MVDSSQAVAACVSTGNTGIKLAASFRPRDSPPEIIAVCAGSFMKVEPTSICDVPPWKETAAYW